MKDFEFLAGFFGILLGLVIAEIATKLAEAIDNREERPVGLLTVLLAAFVLCDVTSFWLQVWSWRSAISVSWHSVYASMVLAVIYYLAAALIFPRSPQRWASFDDHYWARKRWVIGGVLLVNSLVTGTEIMRLMPEADDFLFYFYQGTYFLPLVALMFTRRRWLDAALLGWLLVYFLIVGFDMLPSSRWGSAVMLSPAAGAPSPGQPGR